MTLRSTLNSLISEDSSMPAVLTSAVTPTIIMKLNSCEYVVELSSIRPKNRLIVSPHDQHKQTSPYLNLLFYLCSPSGESLASPNKSPALGSKSDCTFSFIAQLLPLFIETIVRKLGKSNLVSPDKPDKSLTGLTKA